jgi:LacI family transcriptional regulator
MANGMPTLEDVAKLSGVSRATVSRILHAKPGRKIPFKTDTQERVRNAAQMLGYKPSRLARSLVSSKTHIVGLVLPACGDSFSASIVQAAQTQLAEYEFGLLLANTSDNAATEAESIEEFLSWHVDGLIILPTQRTSDAGMFWKLWESRIPFILVDRVFAETPFYSVTTDDYHGSVIAVEHLLGLGRRSIAFAVRPPTVSTNRVRRAAFRDTLLRNGLRPDPNLLIEVPPTAEGGHMAIQKMMELPVMPDALFCCSDIVAAGAMDECFKQGIRIPEDLALVGYSDLDYAGLLGIPLTTINQPADQIGKYAASMLLKLISGDQPDIAHVNLPVSLVVRESTVANGRSRVIRDAETSRNANPAEAKVFVDK